MKTTYLKLTELVIPITLLAFIGTGVTFANGIFNDMTRWLFLLVLSFFLLTYRQRDVLSVLRHPLFWMVLVYAFWAILTVVWSEVPRISLAKALVFVWVSNVLLIAGYSWVIRHKQEQTCDFLWLFAVIALLASPTGQVEENADVGSMVYAGLTGGPNFLGFILSIASIWLVWRAYLIREHSRRYFVFYVGLIILDFYYLFLSHSRASLLIFILVLFGLLVGLGKLKNWLYVVIAAVLLMVSYQVSSPIQVFAKQYIFKASLGSDIYQMEGDRVIWYSRAEAWEESYNRAISGGAYGAGYGVTMGEEFAGKIGFTISSGKYGREHGNSQLAIMEQMGWVGLSLYCLLLLHIFLLIFRGLRYVQFKIDKVAVGLLGGAVLGLLVQSIFEAWWVAPGSPESATFWILLGALLGVTRRACFAVKQRRLLRKQQFSVGFNT